MLVRHFIVLPWICIASACLHSSQKTAKLSEEENSNTCESQLASLSDLEDSIRAQENFRTTVTSPISYAATGVAYTADGVAIAGKTVGNFLFLCPSSALYLFVTGRIPIYGNICPKMGVASSNFGRSAYLGTKTLRDEDLTEISQASRRTASCFAHRQDSASMTTAFNLLDRLVGDREFLERIEHVERATLIEQWESLQRSQKPAI